MLRALSRFGLAAVLCGLFFVPGIASAQQGRQHKVDDQIKLFSKAAIEDANRTIGQIEAKHKKDLHIETMDKGPEKDAARAFAEKRADTLGIDGIYIMISKNPRHFEVFVGNNTMAKGYFTQNDRDRVKSILSTKLGKQSDEALREIATYTLDTMNRHAPTTAPKKAAQPDRAPAAKPVGNQEAAQGGETNWMGWVCLIIGVLLVIWVIYAIIRAVSGMGGGGAPGMGGGYGGGGGGFLTGMLGGLFGAMAGMWMYNHFFGGHSSYSDWGMNNPAGGDASAPGDTGGSSEGGDWGGGDNADAGGGDWGGGDGGDAGGGGGGDWGGGGDAGGGGDWGGGGGGDWGGGGGGGDW